MDFVSSVLSTLALPRIALVAPPAPSWSSPVAPPSPASPPLQLSDGLCGCPSSASAPQGNNIWPGQQPGAPAPVWPGNPCWPGQPNTPCWPGTQPAPAPAPAPAPTPAPAPAPAPAQAPAPAPAQAPVPVHPCNPCWPGYQPQPAYQPQPYQPQPEPQPPAPAPGPAPAPAMGPSAPGWPANAPGQAAWPYNPGQPGWPGQAPYVTPPQWTVPSAPGTVVPMPYNLTLSRGIYDKMLLTIRGQIKPEAKMFTVNFLRGNDIAMHFNPRFNEGGKVAVVRNAKIAERWGKEERDLQTPFPFACGQPFEMKILVTFTDFKVAVNNAQLFDFKHRIRELNQVNRINILQDVNLSYVGVDTIP